jgi:hypothetical protein
MNVAVHNFLIRDDPTPGPSLANDATPYDAAGLSSILAEPAPVAALPPRPDGPLALGPVDGSGGLDMLGARDVTASVADCGHRPPKPRAKLNGSPQQKFEQFFQPHLLLNATKLKGRSELVPIPRAISAPYPLSLDSRWWVFERCKFPKSPRFVLYCDP